MRENRVCTGFGRPRSACSAASLEGAIPRRDARPLEKIGGKREAKGFVSVTDKASVVCHAPRKSRAKGPDERP